MEFRTLRDRVLNGYEECAEFTDSDMLADEAEQLGDYFIGWSPELLEEFRQDVTDFVSSNEDDVRAAAEIYGPEHVGHDFWLTRNRHGAGFWDGDLPDALGKRLTDAAHAYGECGLYLGDDRLAYS